MKKLMSLLLSLVMILAITPVSFAEEKLTEFEREGVIEFELMANSYFSRSLPIFNIATGSESNVFFISKPSLPKNAKITRVVVTGRKSGGRANWVVLNKWGGAMRRFSSSTTFNEFYGEDADTDWAVYIKGDKWTTVRGSTFKVYYRY